MARDKFEADPESPSPLNFPLRGGLSIFNFLCFPSQARSAGLSYYPESPRRSISLLLSRTRILFAAASFQDALVFQLGVVMRLLPVAIENIF